MRKLSTLLAALLLALTACGQAPVESAPETTTPPAPVTTTAPVGTLEQVTVTGEAPPQITFSQTYPRYTATVLAQKPDERPFEAHLGEILTAGEAKRDRALEAVLDVTLRRELTDNLRTELPRRIEAGEVPDLLVFTAATDAAYLAAGRYLTDLTTLSTLQIDQPAFDEALIDALTVAGHAYLLFGDATVADKAATATLLLDPAAAIKSGLAPDELMAAARGENWTVDHLLTYATDAAISLDGDAVVPLFISTGGKIFDRDSAGDPVLVIGEDFSRAYAAMQRMMAASTTAERPVFTVGALGDLGQSNIALPMPVIEPGDPVQSMVDPHRASCVAVPANPADPRRTGDIVTAYFTCATEHIAEPLREHLIEETEAVLLERILGSRTSALGALFGWGDLAEALTDAVGVSEADFLASVSMRMTTATRAMEIFLDRIK